MLQILGQELPENSYNPKKERKIQQIYNPKNKRALPEVLYKATPTNRNSGDKY